MDNMDKRDVVFAITLGVIVLLLVAVPKVGPVVEKGVSSITSSAGEFFETVNENLQEMSQENAQKASEQAEQAASQKQEKSDTKEEGKVTATITGKQEVGSGSGTAYEIYASDADGNEYVFEPYNDKVYTGAQVGETYVLYYYPESVNCTDF